ncbi:hypothetical protein WA026_020279 [Henosepilachna vigintioctopunctata]|uniref:F-box domain-containing protein n=1 Tax=Henosepilachna vigintioctopunctata TaxID=420089 RepID=A0AAW1TXU9_9CUCU
MANIEDLPDEVLEFILTLLSPYQDLHDCLLVCKRWRRCVHNVVKSRRINLNKCISKFNVKWTCLTAPENNPTISKRYSHAAAVHGNVMYIFGGCTCSMTTFNDLWKFDLSTREWKRPLATGTYPSPKACSSLVYYNNQLVLYGGWSYPPSYPLYQSWHLFDELHIYDINKNHWKSITTGYPPPPVAGHSVSIIDKWMIVFGGLAKNDSFLEGEKTNDVWRLDLEDWIWNKPEIDGKKPESRFGQTQVILDNKNIFIIGGSGGSNANYGDAWVLNMSNDVWKWIPVEIRGKVNKPGNLWSNQGCKVGDKIVVLHKVLTDTAFPMNISRSSPGYRGNTANNSARIDLANRQPDLDENINGRRGSLRVPNRDNAAGNNRNTHSPSAPFADVEREKRDHGVRMNDRRFQQDMFRKAKDADKKNKNYLGLYVLDLKHVLDDKPYVTWLTPKTFNKGPEETILYTLVQGNSEIIMFGGIQNDTSSIDKLNNEISNSIYIISATDRII